MASAIGVCCQAYGARERRQRAAKAADELGPQEVTGKLAHIPNTSKYNMTTTGGKEAS